MSYAALFFVLFCQLDAGSVSQDDRDKVDELLTNYSANRAAVPRYAATLRCNLASINHDRPELSRSGLNWYTVCRDTKSERMRHDWIEEFVDAGIQQVSGARTLIFDKHDVGLRLADGQIYELSLKGDEDEEKVLKTPQPRFDPWDLPLGGASLLNPARNARIPIGQLERNLRPQDALEFEKSLKAITCKFNYPQKLNITTRVSFSPGLGMPVQSVYKLEDTGEKPGGTLSVTETAWKEIPGEKGSFVPVRISTHMISGHPKKPNSTSTYDLDFFWVFGESVPDSVFSKEDFIEELKLRQSIVDHAEVRPDERRK